MLRVKNDDPRLLFSGDRGQLTHGKPTRVAKPVALPGRARVKGAATRRQRAGRAPLACSGHPDFGRVVEFSIAVRPLVKERHRAGNAEHFTPAQTRRFEARVAGEAGLAMRNTRMFVTPVSLIIGFMFAGDEELWPIAGDDGDLSNLVKAIEDGMNKVAYPDDRAIVALRTAKLSGPVDCIWVRLEAAREDDLIRMIRERAGSTKG